MLKKLALWCVLAASTGTVLEAQSAELPARTEVEPGVESLVTRFLADSGASAVSIAVTRGDDMLVLGGWGLADREASLAATAETSYRIGSVTKQFTAAAVLRLVERNRISLDDPIGQHLDQLPPAWRPVTILQLLNHTSGIPNFTETGRRWKRHWSEKLAPRALIALVARDKLLFSPGSKWEYSNTGYVLLGMLVEKLHARPLGEVIREEFAVPLGLTHTRSCEDEAGANGQARGYVRKDAQLVAAPYRHISHSFGAGGVCSTVADLAKWNRALHSGRVINETSYALMTTPRGAAEGGDYGLGLRVTRSGKKVFLHTGAVSGFISANAWYPQESLSVSVLANTSPASQEQGLVRDLMRLAVGLPVTFVDPVMLRIDARDLRRYAGRYEIHAPGRSLGIRFWVKGGKLVAQADRQRVTELHPAGEHAFGSTADPTVKFTFVVDEGVVTALLFEQGGKSFETVKKE